MYQIKLKKNYRNQSCRDDNADDDAELGIDTDFLELNVF